MISEEALRELEKWRREQQELTDRIGRGLNEHAQRRSEQIMGEPLLIPSELEDGDLVTIYPHCENEVLARFKRNHYITDIGKISPVNGGNSSQRPCGSATLPEMGANRG